jgi:hypothetical protein
MTNHRANAQKAADKAAAPQEPPAQAQTVAPAEDPPSAPQLQLVPMVRDGSHFPEPHTADVHPDEVDNYLRGGWVVAAQGDAS